MIEIILIKCDGVRITFNNFSIIFHLENSMCFFVNILQVRADTRILLHSKDTVHVNRTSYNILVVN